MCEESNSSAILRMGLELLKAGLSVVPVNPGKKNPIGSWSRLQREALSETWFRNIHTRNPEMNLGLVCGAVSRNLLAVDCDAYRMEGEPRDRFFAEIEPRLRKFATITAVMQTARGGRTFLFHLDVPVRSSVLREYGIDLKAEGSYVVVPPSVFGEARLPYSFDPNGSSEILKIDLESLSFLKLKPLPLTVEPVRNGRPIGVSQELWKALLVPDTDDRSRAEYNLVLHLVERGLSLEDIHSLFAKNAVAGTKFRQPNQGPAFLRRCYENARKYFAKEPNALRGTIAILRDAALRKEWKYRTDREAFLAILELALRAHKTTISAPKRLVAEIAGISTRTAGTSLLRLQRDSILKSLPVEGPANKEKVYELPDPRTFAPHNSLEPLYLSGAKHTFMIGDSSREALNDVFRHRGLGKIALDIYRVVEGFPGLSFRELTSKVSASGSTIRKRLHQMQDLGLITKQPDLKIKECDFLAISKSLRSHGTLGRQRKVHEVERQMRQDILRMGLGDKRPT